MICVKPIYAQYIIWLPNFEPYWLGTNVSCPGCPIAPTVAFTVPTSRRRSKRVAAQRRRCLTCSYKRIGPVHVMTGWWYTYPSEKYESDWIIIPTIGKIFNMFQITNQICIYIYIPLIDSSSMSCLWSFLCLHTIQAAQRDGDMS